MRRADRGWRLWARTAAAILLVLFFLFPIYWLAAISVKSPEEIFAHPPVWVPSEIRFDSYRTLFKDGDARAVWHSLVTAGTSTVLAMLLGYMAAYSLARYRTGGRHFAMWLISQRMVPPVCIAFPIFLLFVGLQLIDTYTGLIILYTAFNLPYVIWMLRGYIRDVPLELEESALVDGLPRWRVPFTITLPLVRAGLLATAVFAFVFAWNDFVMALILTRSQVVTFPVQVTGYFGSQSTFWSKIGAMSMLGVLPMFLVVATMQRYLVRGISLGAVKG